MRKLTVSIHSTVNGVATGPPDGDETEWTWAAPHADDALQGYLDSLADVDTFLMGRRTYEDLVRKWPNFGGSADSVVGRIAERVNNTPKIVASRRQQDELPWGRFTPCEQITGDAEAQISEIKAGDGKEIMTFGSPDLVQSLINADLVDEIQLLVHPVLVHEGRRLFDDLSGWVRLRQTEAKIFDNGAMRATYTVEHS